MGQHKKAVEDFTTALEKDPLNAELYRIRADSYYRLKEAEKALADYNRAIELNPKDAIAYNNRGLVYHEMNNLDQALQNYSKAISFDPHNPTFFENRALIKASKGKTKEALADYENALKLTTDEKIRSNIADKVSAANRKASGEEEEGSASSPAEPGGIDTTVERSLLRQ